MRHEKGEALLTLALESRRPAGLRVIMLTGDNRATAEAVAGGLALDGVEAEVSPEDRPAVVRCLRHDGRRHMGSGGMMGSGESWSGGQGAMGGGMHTAVAEACRANPDLTVHDVMRRNSPESSDATPARPSLARCGAKRRFW